MIRAITVEEICKKLKPVLGKKIDQIYLKYTLTEDRIEREQVERMLSLLYEKHLNKTLLGSSFIRTT